MIKKIGSGAFGEIYKGNIFEKLFIYRDKSENRRRNCHQTGILKSIINNLSCFRNQQKLSTHSCIMKQNYIRYSTVQVFVLEYNFVL